MRIRRLCSSDASAYRSLRLRALAQCPQAFTSSREEDEQLPLSVSQQRLGAADRHFWGAFHGDELCGMVGLERETRAKSRHKARVVGLYVAHEQTGRGIGGALMRALIDGAREAGVELLVLTVTQGQGSALRLYERSGFRSFGLERALKLGGRFYGKHHMALELAPS